MVKHSDNWHLPGESNENIWIGPPANYAGGLESIFSTNKYLFQSRGFYQACRGMLKMNQKTGFDCPGCAWPEPMEKRHYAEFCENGAKAFAEEASSKSIGQDFFQAFSINELAKKSDYWLGKQGRIAEPMFKPKGSTHYQKITWEAAVDLIVNKMASLDSPDESVFYTSGRTSNEAAFLYQLFARSLGTNNLPDCSNMCHESSGVAMTEAIGIGKGSVRLEDFDKADLIFVIGQNPGTNHPRMLSTLQKAKRKGCRIVVINPLKEAGSNNFIHPQEVVATMTRTSTSLMDYFIPVMPGGDFALFRGLNKGILEKAQDNPDVLDRMFIEKYTSGFSEYAAVVAKTSWNQITEGCSITREQIDELVQVILQSKKIICCWAMGLTQQVHAVQQIKEVLHFLMLRGNLGVEGAGACPVRGHSNVQGDRTMGIWERPSQKFLKKLGDRYKREFSPKHGYDTVHAILAMHAKKIRFFMAMGGNLLSAAPDTAFTAKALTNCDLTVHVSTKLNRSHLLPGKESLILPCLARSDRDHHKKVPRFITVENSMGVVERSSGFLKPLSNEMKSEPEIVGLIGEALSKIDPKFKIINWLQCSQDYDLIRREIESSIHGFEGFSRQIKESGYFELKHPVRDARAFNTPSGKANFASDLLPELDTPSGKLIMMTIRSHDQYNTTVYGLDDRYRGVKKARRIIFMNRKDMKNLGLKTAQEVEVSSIYAGEVRKVTGFKVIPYEIPCGVVACYFPEANPLIPIHHFAKASHTPVSKRVIVNVVPLH